jgi:hypothetical protein
LEILLLLLEFLGDNADQSLLAVLGSSINYLPFCHNEPNLEQMLKKRKDNGVSQSNITNTPLNIFLTWKMFFLFCKSAVAASVASSGRTLLFNTVAAGFDKEFAGMIFFSPS